LEVNDRLLAMSSERIPTPNIEQEETAPEKVVRLSRALEESKDPEFIKQRLPELFAILENELRISLLKGREVDAAYKLFQEDGCLVRVENFTRIMEAIGLDHGFQVGESADDSHYANAVIPEPEGIRLAFAEGQASGPLRLAIGIGKSLVGFRTNSDHITVSPVDFSEDDQRDTAKRAYLCRHVEGEIVKEDIRGVVMRIPRVVIDDSLLTDEELGSEGQFVFRGFVT
jgi:hypothetical protein